MMHLWLLLLLGAGALLPGISGYQIGKSYIYKYTGTTSLQDVATYHANAEVTVTPEAKHNDKIRCILMVHNYGVDIKNKHAENHPVRVDNRKRLLFDLNPDQTIEKIYFRPDDDPEQVEVMKSILGLLSFKLVLSQSDMEQGKPWSYRVNETCQRGLSDYIYKALLKGRTCEITRTSAQTDNKYANHTGLKIVSFDLDKVIPVDIHIREQFTPRNELLQEYVDLTREATHKDAEGNNDFPRRSLDTDGKLTLVRMLDNEKILSTENIKYLKQGTIVRKEVIEKNRNMSTVLPKTQEYLQCVVAARKQNHDSEGVQCFRELRHLVSKLHDVDLEKLALPYLTQGDLETQKVIIDVLGGLATDASWELLIKHVMMNPQPHPDLVMQAGIHFVQDQEHISKDCIRAFEYRVFKEKYDFQDIHRNNQVNGMMAMVLGAMVKNVKNSYASLAKEITQKFKDELEIHDPLRHPREIRSVEGRGSLEYKSNLMLALANTRNPSCTEHIISYLNTTNTHVLLKTSAMLALREFEEEKVADLYLALALDPQEDEYIRDKALKHYKEHKYGGDVQTVVQIMAGAKVPNTTIISSEEQFRVRRGLRTVISRVWQGFAFRIEPANVRWKQVFGSRQLGASLGLVMENFIDVRLAPLSGHVIVNVDNQAWANFLLMNRGFDIIRAELCFKGSIRYSINILKEFDFKAIKRMAQVFSNTLPRVVRNIREAVTQFSKLSHPDNRPDLVDVARQMLRSLVDLAQNSTNLRITTRPIYEAIADYTEMHGVVARVEILVNHVNKLFNDIKTDVMHVYNLVVDIVTVQIPWAWDEISSAVEDIIESFQNIADNPLASIQTIEYSVNRIIFAVNILLDLRHDLREVNFFRQENRPYWFDIRTEIDNIRSMVHDIRLAVQNSLRTLNANHMVNRATERLASINRTAMEEKALRRINTIVEETLEGPLQKLQPLLDPLTESVSDFMEIVRGVQEGVAALVDGFRVAKNALELVLGQKVHRDFPRVYLESETCGNGFWPTNMRGRYNTQGVALNMTLGDEVPAPFDGTITEVGEDYVVMRISSIRNLEAVISNIDPTVYVSNITTTTEPTTTSTTTPTTSDKTTSDYISTYESKSSIYPTTEATPLASVRRKRAVRSRRSQVHTAPSTVPVAAGTTIGYVNSSACGDTYIHFALRRPGSRKSVDPTRYLVKRTAFLPRWQQECDHYFLSVVGRNLVIERVLGDGSESDETPDIPTRPSIADLTFEDVFGKVQNKLPSPSELFNEISTALDIPVEFDHLENILNFRMNSISIKNILDIAGDPSSPIGRAKGNVLEILRNIENLQFSGGCERPESMDDNQLRVGLKLMGRPAGGSRNSLKKAYWKTESTCPGISGHLSETAFCHFRDDCLGLTCCADTEIFVYKFMLKVSVFIDVCHMDFVVNVNNNTVRINYGGGREGIIQLLQDVVIRGTFVNLHYSLQVQHSRIHASVSFTFGFEKSEETTFGFELMKDLVFMLPSCEDAVATINNSPGSSFPPSFDDMLNMDFDNIMNLMDTFGMPENDLLDSIQELQEEYKLWLNEKVEGLPIRKFPSVFSMSEFSLTLPEISMGPWTTRFVWLLIPIPVPLVTPYFECAIDGTIGVSFHGAVRVMQMTAEAKVTPYMSSQVYGALGVSIAAIRNEFRAVGTFVSSRLPTRGEIQFNGFPLDVRVTSDLHMVPLSVEFYYILSVGFWGMTKQIGRIRLHQLELSPIHRNLFDWTSNQKDDSPPEFRALESQSGENGPTTRECRVWQEPGLDHTEPAFQLEFGVEDDKGEVEVTYSIGTFRGGSDVVNDEEIEGSSMLIFMDLPSGRPLYFTITAVNSQGLSAQATCALETYNTSPPGGRVMADYHTTSNPTVLHGSLMIIDESPIVTNMVAVGYGRGPTADQVVPWRPVTELGQTPSIPNVDPFGPGALSYFHAPRTGGLLHEPFLTVRAATAVTCAHRCLEHSAHKCQSFVYDFGQQESCQLMDAIENFKIRVHQRLSLHYYERIGTGHVASLEFNLDLMHNELYYINNHIVNDLGYTSTITGHPTLVDLTTPTFLHTEDMIEEIFLNKPCETYTPAHLQARCQGQTPIKNYRYFIDGPNTRTIFNGPRQLEETTYTRANTMVAGSWDGIYDNETGILIYEFAVGDSHCADNVHPHRDPHSHIATKSQWTNSAVIFPVSMPDGEYHITVRALNDIEYGGPLALSVCHSIPYTIDTVPPVIYSISGLTFDEDTNRIGVDLDAIDYTSGIWRTEIGFGNDRRNVALMGYTEVENYTHPYYYYDVPDGVPVWVKNRVTDRVNLRMVGHSDRPIIVDRSPPLLGVINDGNIRGIDAAFQNSTKELCATWSGFKDPESGIAYQIISIGTDPGIDDIMDWLEISGRDRSWCQTGLQLSHMGQYYFTLTAVNGAIVQRNVTGNSSGVLVDATPPIGGLVKDGADPDSDISYSSAPASLRSTFNGFYDNESGINYLIGDIYRTSLNSEASEEKIHTEESISPEESSLSLNHLTLQHGDRVRTEIVAVNRAGGQTSRSSSGFMVDLTNPVMKALVDGTDINKDLMFTSSDKLLQAAWVFEDLESGIDRFEVSAFRHAMGRRFQEFPSSGTVILPGNATSWEVTGLDLHPGIRYSIRVTAFNGAGLPTVQDTTGVRVDTTPPRMFHVHAGVLNGQEEETIDGQVLHSDRHNILASWEGADFESGITGYFVGIGTSKGEDDVLTFLNLGTTSDHLFTGLNLEYYTEKNTLYYISVFAVNGAEMKSSVISSSPVRVVAADTAGYTTDGPEPGVDIDYQVDTGSLTATFSGFSSDQHGIHHMEFCVGTQPGWDNVLPYTNQGILTEETEDDSLLGKSGAGSVQVLGDFTSGTTYHVTIRAVTGSRNVLEAPSDGVTPDTTPPSARVLSVQGEELNGTGSALYVRSVSSVSASWEWTEEESRVTSSSLSLGSYPHGRDLVGNFNTTGMTSLPNAAVQTTAEDGSPVVLEFQALNKVGLTGRETYKYLIADTSPPLIGRISCPYFFSGNEFRCVWDGFRDPESGIHEYEIGLGWLEEDDSISSYSTIDSSNNFHDFSVNFTYVSDTERPMYVTVRAYNEAGGVTTAYSSSIVRDTTPPEPGIVVETSDVININSSHALDLPLTDDDILNNKVKCQRSLSTLNVLWGGFYDRESAITSYHVALGTTRGGSQIANFEEFPSSTQSYTFSGLDLYNIRKVYVTVKAYNGVGLHTTVTSGGIYISCASSGLAPLSPARVYDGGIRGIDLDYQTENTGLEANWDFSGDPCPIVALGWEVRRFDGEVILPMATLPPESTYGLVDDVEMKDGESYYTVVRATNALGYTRFARSDGITIQLEPLIPGIVRDGDITGLDLSLWPHADHLSANWDGFGVNYDINTSNLDPENPDLDPEFGGQQEILYYEVAAGTDRRFPSTRENIHPFINVGKNTSWTFYHLDLLPVIGVYYITVRAYSRSLATAEVTSNGVRVEYPVNTTTGEIEMNRYHPDLRSLSFGWGGFEMGLPIQSYTWGLGKYNLNTSVPKCDELLRMEGPGMFDIVPLTDVVLDTSVSVGNLQLEQGKDYILLVIAMDQSGECDLTQKIFTVDITKPETGKFAVGDIHSHDLLTWYIRDKDVVDIFIWDFYDPESGIEQFILRLYQLESCTSNPTDNDKRLIEEVQLPGSTNRHAFVNLGLEASGSYMLELEVYNGAGLYILLKSPVILMDLISPTSGDVRHGNQFSQNKQFQSSTSYMEGSFMFVSDAQNNPCSPLDPIQSEEYQIVHSNYVWDLSGSNRRSDVVIHENLVVKTEGTLDLRLERDVRSPNMRGGGIVINEINNRGQFQFVMKTADPEFKPITTLAFLPGTGYTGNFQDFSPIEHSSTHDASLSSDTTINKTQAGFGIQIQSYIGIDNETISELFFWAVLENGTWFSQRPLEFNPTSDFHTFVLSVNPNRPVDLEGSWEVILSVDNEDILAVFGINPLITPENPDAHVQIGMYTQEGHLLPLEDIFNPPSTTSTFKSIRLPSRVDDCRYGNPFIGGQRSDVSFWAGIGSQKGMTDISPPRQVGRACVPCSDACEDRSCDTGCDVRDIEHFSFILDELDLLTSVDLAGNSTNTSLPYYITVTALAGSGRQAVSSSSGIYIDPTPPEIIRLYHTDYSWDYPEQPVDYQGNNFSISAIWEAEDHESLVSENFWAIGTEPGFTDIQNFVPTGLEMYGKNSDLEGKLQENKTYFVTIRVHNNAGLFTEKSTKGVTVRLSPPDMSAVGSYIKDASSFPEGVEGDAVHTERLDHLQLSWEAPSPEQEIEMMIMEMGTVGQKEALFPPEPVGFDKAGGINMGEEGINIEGAEKDGSSAKSHRKKRDVDWGTLNLEPGRSIIPKMRGCNLAQVCDEIPMKEIIFMREEDNVTVASEGSIKIIHDSLQVSTIQDIPDTKALISGTISLEDMSQHYSFPGQAHFKPYIVDAYNTINRTNRILSSRILGWDGEFYFLSGIGDVIIPSDLKVTVNFTKSMYPEGQTGIIGPRLLGWCIENEFWVDLSRSCTDGHVHENWQDETLNLKICAISSACNEGLVSTSSINENLGFTGPLFFGVGKTLRQLVNSPPVLTSPDEYSMYEDGGTKLIRLSASDPDGDQVIFVLDESHDYPASITLSLTGTLQFTPNPNFNGQVRIFFAIVERRILVDIEPLVTETSIVINVVPVNDNPVLMVVEEGYNIMDSSYRQDMSHDQNTQHTNNHITVLFVAYDVDVGDEVRILINPGDKGTTQTSPEVRDVILVEQDCSQDWENRSYAWEKLSSDLWLGRHPVYKPIICNQHPEGLEPGVVWSVIEMVFTGDPGFFGKDIIQTIAEDQEFSRSDLLDISIHVLEFPCENNATCTGPEQDKECQSFKRAEGFHENGYTCVCAQDFTGRNCETEIDNCLSDPCPYNYTCTDGVGYYTCSCDSIWWPCYSGLLPWEIALIVVFPLAAVIAAAAVFFYLRHKKIRNKVGDSTVSLTRSMDYEDLMATRKSQLSLQSVLSKSSNKVHPELKLQSNSDTALLKAPSSIPPVESPDVAPGEAPKQKRPLSSGITTVQERPLAPADTTVQNVVHKPAKHTTHPIYSKTNFNIFSNPK